MKKRIPLQTRTAPEKLFVFGRDMKGFIYYEVLKQNN